MKAGVTLSRSPTEITTTNSVLREQRLPALVLVISITVAHGTLSLFPLMLSLSWPLVTTVRAEILSAEILSAEIHGRTFKSAGVVALISSVIPVSVTTPEAKEPICQPANDG